MGMGIDVGLSATKKLEALWGRNLVNVEQVLSVYFSPPLAWQSSCNRVQPDTEYETGLGSSVPRFDLSPVWRTSFQF
jgi:hypothetical protein